MIGHKFSVEMQLHDYETNGTINDAYVGTIVFMPQYGSSALSKTTRTVGRYANCTSEVIGHFAFVNNTPTI
ncbi:MAG: hypothetical protein IJ620_02665 [Bacteroidales bacterium]|nr:hypothetical protein [Bacteroidales bacterium]